MKKAWMLIVTGSMMIHVQTWADRVNRSPAVTPTQVRLKQGGVYGQKKNFRNWVIYPASYSKTNEGIAISQNSSRRVYTHLGSYTIADLTYTRHSKTPEMKQFYSVEDMADAFKEGMGIAWDTQEKRDGVHVFVGRWEKGNRVVSVYIKDEEKYLTTSVAFVRTGYFKAVHEEINLMQKAQVLPKGAAKEAALNLLIDFFVQPAHAQSPVIPPELIDAITGVSDSIDGIDLDPIKNSFEQQSEAWRTDAAHQSDLWRESFEKSSDKFNTTLNKITQPEYLAKMAFGVTFGAVLGAATANMMAEGVKILVRKTAEGIHELVTKEKYKARVRETVEKFKKVREEYEKLVQNAVAIEKILDTLVNVAGDEAADKTLGSQLSAFATALDQLRVRYANELYVSTRRRDVLDPKAKDFDQQSCVLTQRIMVAEDKIKSFQFITEVFSENLRKPAPACAALMKYFDALVVMEHELEKMRAMLLDSETLNYFLDQHYLDREMINERLDELQDELPDLKRRQLKRIREMEAERAERYNREKNKEIEKCEAEYKDNNKFSDVVNLKRELRRLREQKESLAPADQRDSKRVHSELFKQKWGFMEAVSSPVRFTAQATEEYSVSAWLARMYYRTEVCRLVFDVTVADRAVVDASDAAKSQQREPNFLYEKRGQQEYEAKVAEIVGEYDRSIANTAQGYRNYRNATTYPQVELSLLRKYITQLTSDQSCYMSNDCDAMSNARVTRVSQRRDINDAAKKCSEMEQARRMGGP